MNETKLSGRLTKDPVVRYISSGKVVTQFILAVDRIRKDDKNEADFIIWSPSLLMLLPVLFLHLVRKNLFLLMSLLMKKFSFDEGLKHV